MFNIDEIVVKTDLSALVERAGGRPEKGRCACPLHGGNDTSAFAIYENGGKQHWKCFSGDCGQGDVLDFVMKWQGLDFKAACEFLGGDVVSDPVAMKESAQVRHEQALQKQEAARLEVEARRKELQLAQLHLYYHEHMGDWGRAQWLSRGIDESWQRFWFLGSCDDRVIMSGGMEYHTPTLTIPILDEASILLNIKHRLINPPKKNDKYRPEREGLGAFPPFLAFPELGYSAETIFVIEGEVKAMVTASITPSAEWQFIGAPGRSNYKGLEKKLFGKNVVVVPDPGAEGDAYRFCKAVKGRWFQTPAKIDDLIVAQNYGQDWLRSVERQARKV
jgi:hypothetical protein